MGKVFYFLHGQETLRTQAGVYEAEWREVSFQPWRWWGIALDFGGIFSGGSLKSSKFHMEVL